LELLDVFLTGLGLAEARTFGRGSAVSVWEVAEPNADQRHGATEGLQMNNSYLEVISLVERLHRQFLEVVKLELEGLRIHDINNVQAMMLFNIGDAEMTVGELTLRGCYLGSNVSYNVKKMVENGYLEHERSVHDRRSIHVRLTEKGSRLRDCLTSMHQRHSEMLLQATLNGDDLQNTSVTLRRLERFWIRAADLVQRTPPQFAPVNQAEAARAETGATFGSRVSSGH
jgi:DNA-binding MarR family transcriptional regulator